ncbi:hypothetical protein HUJ04_008043 [Dendroctonus ponderosae]|nr:hypothetical protein HUJ04_008043 [Dendroctonus ponderosae]
MNYIAASDLVKDHQAANSTISELPPKKQKLEEYLGSMGRVPPFPLPVAAAAIMQQQLFALEPVYIHRCLQEFNARSHRSAFKPVSQSIREQKLRSANALEMAARCAADPPLLQNPEKVVLMSESERFERSYQPNVALAPPVPKKHRYGRAHLHSTSEIIQQCSSSTSTGQDQVLPAIKSEPIAQSPLTNGHAIKEEVEEVCNPQLVTAATTIAGKVDATVSVLQANNSVRVPPKYNPEIELSTDTEDSASETSEKNNLDYIKLEEVLKSVDSEDVREKILELFKNMSKERERAILDSRCKDQERIIELEQKNEHLEREMSTLREQLDDLISPADSNNTPIRGNLIKDSSNDVVTSSSIIIHSPLVQERGVSPLSPTVQHQKSVIASVASVANSVPNSVTSNREVDVITNTTPE